MKRRHLVEGTSLLTRSTFSSDMPDDSYRKSQTTTEPRRLHAANTKP